MWVGYCRKERHWDLWFLVLTFRVLPYPTSWGRDVRYQVGLGSFNDDDKSFFNVACGFVCVSNTDG